MTRLATLDMSDHIAHVTLNRPDKMNAVSAEMIADLLAIGRSLQNSDIRAVVLSGQGDAFCSGLDVLSFAELAKKDPDALLMPRTHDLTNDFQEVALIWHRLPVPVIAALHGVAFGAGFQIALGADIRIAGPECRLSIMEMKWGLVPDMGAMVLLPKLTRSDVIRYLTYSAKPIPADQAQSWGLVTEIHDAPHARAVQLAQDIVGKSPSAIRAAKSLITCAESGAPMADILLEESRAQADLMGKPHHMEAIAANMAKRPPRFD